MHAIAIYDHALQQLTADIAKATDAVPNIIIQEQLGEFKEVYLAIEKQIFWKVAPEMLPFALQAAYYCFDISYPKGLCSFFSFLE